MHDVVIKIHYDRMTDEHIALINKKLKKPGTILQKELDVPEKLALRIFIAIGANKLGSVHLICNPIPGTNLTPQVRPFDSGFPLEPRKYTYDTALRFENPIRVERMTPEEREAIIEHRKRQNRSG
jgi:hypothetical protein